MDPPEPVACRPHRARSAGGDSRGTALFRTKERGPTMCVQIPILTPRMLTPADLPRTQPGPNGTLPGPLFCDLLAATDPQPCGRSSLPTVARRERRCAFVAPVIAGSPSSPLV